MAEQLTTNESTPLLSSDSLHPNMGEEVEERDHGTVSLLPLTNIIIQSSTDDATLSSSTSSGSSTMMEAGHQNESMPILLAASQTSAMEEQHEGHEPDPHAPSNSPRVEDESTQPSFSGLIHEGAEQQNEHSSSSSFSSGEMSPGFDYSVGGQSASNIVAQQVVLQQQHRSFSLSGILQSSIMLRRNAHAKFASTARGSASQQDLQNLDPQRVKRYISTLGLDEQLSETLCKLVIATAPFHNPKAQPISPAPDESNPHVDALRQALGGLTFSPTSPTLTTAEEGTLAGNSTENPTGNLLFNANAAETLGSRPIEPRSDSPPLLWSTAAVEESLDPNAEEPTHFTVAEFVNTIIEQGIQVESVTDEDFWIEEVRVGILNHLKNNTPEEDPTAEGGQDEEVVTEVEEATERIETKEDTSKPDLAQNPDSNKAVVTEEEATKQVHVKEGTSKSDLLRWKEQGPDGWLKRDDGTDMNEEEIDEECARWDIMVRKVRDDRAAEDAAALLGQNIDPKDKGFWELVRSSKQKEQAKSSISTDGQEEMVSVSTHDQDEKAGQKKSQKGSRKNKNKNRKAEKIALKGVDTEDAAQEENSTETFPHFLDLPKQVRKNVLGFVLVVDQKLVPYHYVKSKIVMEVESRKKPELNILLALCSSKDKTVKKCLDDAKNILYRGNTFSFGKPNELIMFLGTIGRDNMARMKMGKNLLLSDTFFYKKRQYEMEMKWLARWGRDLLSAMKGRNIFRSEIAVETPEDDLTCEPTDIDKALKNMVQIMKDGGSTYETSENDDGGGSGPMRLQSLDLGDKFDSLAEHINTMGLAASDNDVKVSDTAKIPERDAPEKAGETMSEKRKRKALETGKTAEEEGEAEAYGESFLNALTARGEKDEEDSLSQDFGLYTPSEYSVSGKKPISAAYYATDMIRRGWRIRARRKQIEHISRFQPRTRA